MAKLEIFIIWPLQNTFYDTQGRVILASCSKTCSFWHHASSLLQRCYAKHYKGRRAHAILTKDDQPPLSSSWLSAEEDNTLVSAKRSP